MNKEKHIIYIPGLNDQLLINRAITKVIPYFWRANEFIFHTVNMNWEDGESFVPKLKLITDKIDDLGDHQIFLIGQSAGGSAALNAFCLRKDKVRGVVNSTGRLKRGSDVRPALERASKNSIAFKESVILFEDKNEPKLSKNERKKVITIRPIWDETVPSETVRLEGATNIVFPGFEHSLSGFLIMTVFSFRICRFLKSV